MRALLIEFDQDTGKRAGDINPRDPALPCHGWQNLGTRPAREIRLVTDNRDLAPYSAVDGVTVIEGQDEINHAIASLVPETYIITNKDLFSEHLKQLNLFLSQYRDLTDQELLKTLFDKGVVGIARREVRLV